jgi:hypothetical protein
MANLRKFKNAIINLGNEKTIKALLKQSNIGGVVNLYNKYFALYDTYGYSKDEGLRSVFGPNPKFTAKEKVDAIARITLLDTLVRDDVVNFSGNLANLASNSGLTGPEIKTLTGITNPAEYEQIVADQMSATAEPAPEAAPAPAPAPEAAPTEPKISESKKLSGRKPKGKVIEKGKSAVRKIDFGEEEKEEGYQQEEKEEINVPTPNEERKAMSRAEGESMQMEIDADSSQMPLPKVNLRGVRVKGGKKLKGKVTIENGKVTVKKTPVPTMGARPVPTMGGSELPTKPLEPISEEDAMDKLQEGTDEVMDKLVKDAQEKRKAASERLSKTIEDIPVQPPQEIPEEPLGEPEKAPIKMRVNKVTELKQDVLPTAVDLIPPERLSSEDKTIQQLKDDINYFYINFPEKLRRVKKITSNDLKVLQRFHKRVVALLRGDKVDRDAEKQVGVIIKGESYIKDVLKEIILENSINGLSASDLLVNIEGERNVEKPSAGDYEFKVNPTTGKEFADAQPVSRLIPTTDPKQTDAMKATYKKPISRIPMPKTMYRGVEKTAMAQVAANPFLTARQPKIRLKYSY